MVGPKTSTTGNRSLATKRPHGQLDLLIDRHCIPGGLSLTFHFLLCLVLSKLPKVLVCLKLAFLLPQTYTDECICRFVHPRIDNRLVTGRRTRVAEENFSPCDLVFLPDE